MRSILKKYDPKSIRINNMNHHPKSSQWEKVSKWWILKKQNKFTDQSVNGTQQNNNSVVNGKLSAANRRAQFQATRVVETTIDTQKTGNRPRASSAPLKALSFDESSKALIVNKANRKLRRRKALREFQECDEDSSNESSDKTRVVKQINLTPSNGRPRSACSNPGEVETLVSLLSSGGSDSEKEDKEVAPVPQAVVKSDPLPIIKHKPPPLRKIGKSVSFQDDTFEDITNNNATSAVVKETPMSMRQNSVNPMPTRARQSRPHNGPLSSNSFFKELESQSLNIQKPPSTNRDTGNTSPENDKQETPKTNTQSNKNDEPFPDNVQTAKERECYRLYQKMSSMGLNVSFDTVLRGMLTPTELRVIQKKKDSEMARQATIDRELEEQQENESTKSSNGVNEQK